MARWRLTAKHYINVLEKDTGEKVEWIREESDRDSGRKLRKIYQVPMLLDPDDRTCQNRDGEVIVARAEGHRKGDFIYDGPPTVDMEPLDDEAEAISAAEKPKWINPIESIPGQGVYAENLLTFLNQQLAEAMKQNPIPQATSLSGVSKEEFAAMQEQMAAVLKQNAELLEKLEAKPEVKAGGDRR